MSDVVVASPIVSPHRFLARTLSTARWEEYDTLLRVALELGWVAMDLERWVAAGGVRGRVLILRHDVDQHPATALRMARIEARHGVHATWYFRWRTCSPFAIRRIRELGGAVGLHYETLTRIALERGLTAAEIDPDVIAVAREELRREVAAFEYNFGPIRSFCAHGDTRVPGVSNQVLLQGEDPSRFGVSFDVNEALSRQRLGLWMTDRSSAEGGWKDGLDPLAVLSQCQEPILCLTHPNNWCSGVSLWFDRLKSAMLPTPSLAGRGSRITLRTGDDRPPRDGPTGPLPRALVASPRLRSAAAIRPFAPVSVSLRREILRYYYDRGEHLVSPAGLRTLETNSGLAETRAATLEHALRHARVLSVRDRDVVDLGCGFGALALVFATRGGRVTALDPNAERLGVGARVAETHGLSITWRVGGMDTTELGRERFDVAFMNNSFCYLVTRSSRRAALARTLASLRPGGVLVLRNPNRFWIRDQFTGVPLLGMLPQRLAPAATILLRRHRSNVRLLSAGAARRELRRAGFIAVEAVRQADRPALSASFGSYQHLVARRPG